MALFKAVPGPAGSPRPPINSHLTFKGADLIALVGGERQHFPAVITRVDVVDPMGVRVTATRVALTGVLALIAKKKDPVTLILVDVTRPDRFATVQYKSKSRAKALTWAAQFNLWAAAQRAADQEVPADAVPNRNGG